MTPAELDARGAKTTRAAQGFPEKIEDKAVLEAAAALLADLLADLIREGGDHRGAA
jgi:hypothetical protein